MRYSLANLRTFAVVAEMGSITEAGERLGRTPSTVSMALRTLEDEIGAPLFESERKNRLSKTGLFVLTAARDLLSHYERSTAAIGAFVRNQIGRVDLACVPSVATAILPEVLMGFRKRHAGVEINVRDADSPSVAEAVETGKVVLGIGSLARSRPELAFEPLFEERLGIVCRGDDDLAANRTLSWEEIGDRTFLRNDVSGTVDSFRAAELISYAPIVVHNVLSLLALVRAGMGITVLPQLSLASSPEGLSFVRLSDPSARRQVGLITRSVERKSPAEEAFVAELREALSANAGRYGLDLL